MTDSQRIEQEVMQINLALEDRASLGRWEDFATLMRQRNQLLQTLPAELQRQAFEASLETNAQILSHARTDREHTRERLENVRQKSAVSSYYRTNGGALSE